MPGSPLKICAMPIASETAPPGRPVTVSPTAAWRSVIDRYAELTGTPVERASLPPFEMLAIMMLLATQVTAVWMYKHGHTTDFRMAWSRFSFAGLRQDMVRLMQW